ncbi:vigilin 1 [Diplogelasinospora grovesii]|uniref:Vigilin 1 n=1 Tax=Diplogelasinospora grovesii TaxID=303347 RepID=A0AAN6NCF0_9PEZI|nr:vigilin 1 [Diplogelasinospora grovesii]
MADTASASAELSAASQLLQQHTTANSHHVMVEDAEDEDLPRPAASGDASGTDAKPSWVEPMSAKAAGKQKAPEPSSTGLDTQSHELFPELGRPKSKASTGVAPVWSAKSHVNGKTNGAGSANGTPRTSTPASGVTTPTGPGVTGPPSLVIPGRNVETIYLEPHHVLPRNQLRRPLPDIIKDLNRKSRANVNMATMGNGKLKFEATGPQDIAQQALKDLVQQIGTKQSIRVPIPQSARAHIIGKGGSTIKALQEKSGARIQLPKVDEGQAPMDEDEDGTIDVLVEGNALSAATARDNILKIAGERAANVNTRLRGIPAEFYPFIAGRNNSFIRELEDNNSVQIRVPPHRAWSARPPSMPASGARPVFVPAANDNHIQLAGERAAVQAARAEIERRAEELHRQLAMEQFNIQRGRHQFIIGERGIPMDSFFEDTGCAIIMPTDEEDDTVTVIGLPDQIQAGMDKAMDLAMNMQCSNIDISRFHRQAPGGAAAHARNVTRYLRQRKEIERLETMYNVHFNTPFSGEGALPWELYSRDGKNAIRAQSEIKGLVDGHPPSRMATVPVDPFFHQYMRNEVQPRVRQDYRVQLVVPEPSEGDVPLLLVYEGPASPGSYEIPRSQPSQADVSEMQKFLQEAQKHILDLVNQQESLTATSIEVPQKYHEKLRKFISKEQASRGPNKIPLKVSSIGTTVNLRGPSSAVEELAAKCLAFIEQEKEDEKERGFTMEFDFPQKFANHLIGKGGSNIRELREKFDVDIQVHDGKVELKGPKAKAEAAKTHILALGRQLQDETTHILKIDPKFHRELIGAQGAQINRLQTRYKVLIFFPRTAKSNKDDESVAEAASDAGKPRRQQAADEVIIRGPKKGADEARDELLSLLQYLKDTSFTATVSVQQKQLPSLIGAGGSGMDQLRQQTGAKIDIPNGRDNTDGIVEIQIKGTKTQVAAAKKILEEKKAVFDDTVVKTIEVDKKYHKTLIGSGGANLREIVVKAGGSDDRRELARTIQFPKQDSDGNTIKVEGRSDVVDKIIAQIQSVVSERESQVTEILEVPVEKHRSLIGRGGDVKRGLESQFKVSIDIPRQGSGQTDVKIVGQSGDVEKAKAHIQSMVKEQAGEAIQVPRAMHHAVSSNGQIFRRLKNDFSVTVDHAGHSIPPKPAAPAPSTRVNGGALPLITDDAEQSATEAHSWNVVEQTSTEEGDIPWVLRGSPENIEKAKKAIDTALEQAKKQNVTGYLILPDPKTHRHIIGQAGSKVNSIRKQSGCKITVPRDQNKEEAIEIVGTKEGVEKAKELILQAVRDGVNGSSRPPRE